MRATSIKNAATLWAAFSFCIAATVATAQTSTLDSRTPSAALSRPYAAIGERATIVYDAPSLKAEKTFVLPRFQPVDVLVKLDKWIKIRDADNTLGWIEAGALGEKRFIQIAVPVADIRAARNATAALVFEAQRAVLLEVTGPAADGWLPVRHRDGQTGFVRKIQIWGD